MPYKNREKRNEYAREYYKKHSKKCIEYSIKYNNSNKEIINKKKVFSNAKYRRLARIECINYYSNSKKIINFIKRNFLFHHFRQNRMQGFCHALNTVIEFVRI